ncbi:MAG: universal stress protein, partial [Thermoplasmata archaeon]|nr:universal stress protein [Thermoplasmata archaeon]
IGQVAWYVAMFVMSAGLIIHYFTGGREAIEEAPEAERVELLDFISTKAEVDMKKYRVLVPVAEFEESEHIEFGSLMARENKGELAIMNVVEVPSGLPLSAVRFGDVDENIKRLQKLEKIVKREGLDTRALLKISHKAYENILEVIDEEEVDLLVMGWRGRQTKRDILGSNIDYIVQRANCDVAVFKTKGLEERIKSILLLSSEGSHTRFAASIAAKIAKEHDAKIVILAVITSGRHKGEEMVHARKLREICMRDGAECELKAIHTPSIIDTVTKESMNHGLLVMGAGQAWRLRRYAFGPLRDRLCKEVDIPVLMLRKGLKSE